QAPTPCYSSSSFLYFRSFQLQFSAPKKTPNNKARAAIRTGLSSFSYISTSMNMVMSANASPDTRNPLVTMYRHAPCSRIRFQSLRHKPDFLFIPSAPRAKAHPPMRAHYKQSCRTRYRFAPLMNLVAFLGFDRPLMKHITLAVTDSLSK